MSKPTRPNHAPVGYVSLVRNNANFRNLWAGQIVSLLGDWFNLIASASLIAELSQSNLAIGGLFVVRMLAPFLVSPIAGVVADRVNRKHILMFTDISRAVTVCGFLLVRAPEHLWLLYTLTAVQLGISGFFFPTRNAILPELVSATELGAANALSSATWSVMLALGAALGGLVAGLWGNQPAFIIDALTFIGSAFFVAQIKYTPSPTDSKKSRTVKAALQLYAEGLSFLRQHAGILIIALHKAAVSLLVSGGYQVLQVSIAEKIFVIGEGGGISLGLMYAAVGVGTGIGPIAARYFTGDRNRPLGRAIALGYLFAAIGLVIVMPLTSFGMVLIGTLLRGIGAGIVWVFSTQLLLQILPNHIRGRVFATEYAIFTLMSAISSGIVGGAVGEAATIPGILRWMALLTIIPGTLWLIWITIHKDLTSQRGEIVVSVAESTEPHQ